MTKFLVQFTQKGSTESFELCAFILPSWPTNIIIITNSSWYLEKATTDTPAIKMIISSFMVTTLPSQLPSAVCASFLTTIVLHGNNGLP